MHVLNWSAKRSGPSIMVLGEDKDGKPVKLSKVACITPGDGCAIAETYDGADHVLKI